MIDIFLSASVPLPTRNRQYFASADVLYIREAVKALVEVVLPIGRITYGGHPAITPLIAHFVEESGLPRDRLTIFQSAFFDGRMPEQNSAFYDVRIIAADRNRKLSLASMRAEMISSRNFGAAVFIGGMEGMEEEARLFTEQHPQALKLPIASTGAAAARLFHAGEYPQDLNDELTFISLFRRHLTTD